MWQGTELLTHPLLRTVLTGRPDEQLHRKFDQFAAIAGTGPGINLVLLGESTVAGVGASTYQGALACKMATFLSRLIDRTVYWRAIGRG